MTGNAETLDPRALITVTATAVGALPETGLKRPGDGDFTVPLMGFSRAWMKPANAESAKMVTAWLKAQEPKGK